MESSFKKLNAVDVTNKIEKKAGLSYLSWAWAWGELKKEYPEANSTVYENKDGLCYHHDGKTAWVKASVTIGALEHIEYLPVMNNTNKSIPLATITSCDVNKTIQRAITKAIARHGLGLYIYAGEDMPEDHTQPTHTEATKAPSRPIEREQEQGGPNTLIEKLAAVKPTKSSMFFQLEFANTVRMGCTAGIAALANKALEADHKVSVEWIQDGPYKKCLTLVEVLPETDVPF